MGKKQFKQKDIVWKHGERVLSPPKSTYIKCNYCKTITTGGTMRMKNHLAGNHINSAPCEHVPENVRKEFINHLKVFEKVKERNQRNFDEMVDTGSYHNHVSTGNIGSTSGTAPLSRGVRGPIDRFFSIPAQGDENAPQNIDNPHQNAKEARDQVCMDIGRFFIENGIPFNVAKSASFHNMCLSIGNYGRGLKPPSPYELSTWILEKVVETTKKIVDEVKKTWEHTGVSILSDGWKDMRGRHLINFLVNNPHGTVFLRCIDASKLVKDASLLCNLFEEIVDEVGEDLVIQVVTDNAANYKKAGQLLMERKPKLWWTPCAAHCIDLMLEKIGDLTTHKNALIKAKKVSNYIYNHGWVLSLMRDHGKRDLVRPAATRFATAYLTLQSMIDLKQPLEAMFTCSEWANSTYSKKDEGKNARKIVLDSRFWKSVTYAVRSTKPLVQVLRMVDSEKKPGMGFLYGAMENAKNEIASNLGDNLGEYKEIWDIIDEKWDFQMHRDLHAAAYFLNPQFQYSTGFKLDMTVKRGYMNCLDKLIPNEEDRNTADAQVDLFKNKAGFFGHNRAKSSTTTRSPADWWSHFGDETPELTKFAIKVLSLTASSSPCERNWSTFNQVHTKKRNRLSSEKLDKIVYVMYNKKLKDRHLKKQTLKDDEDSLIIGDGPPSDDEWIADGDDETPPLDIQNVEDDEDDDETQPADSADDYVCPTRNSQQKNKGKRPMLSSQTQKQMRGNGKHRTAIRNGDARSNHTKPARIPKKIMDLAYKSRAKPETITRTCCKTRNRNRTRLVL